MCFEILGAVVAGIGGAVSAMGQAAGYQAQAAMHRRQAAMEREKGSFDAMQKTTEIRKGIGEQIAGFASNGVDVSSGSALQILQDTGTEGALDVASVRFGARAREDNELYSAKIANMNAGIATASAPFAFLTPILGKADKIKAAFA